MTPGETAWRMGFQLSPIILVGGIAPTFLGGYLPIMAITEIANFPAGLLSGSPVGTDNFFANFRPMSGSSIISQEIAKFPFANQTVAANSIITQPLQVSMEMTVIARTRFGYYEKLAIMLALREALYAHNTSGGRYIIMTPSFVYVNCLMKSMTDISNPRTAQPQNTWQLDFEKPLITLGDAEAAENSLMSWISRGTEIQGTPSATGVLASTTNPASLSGAAASPLTGTAAGSGIGNNSLVQAAFNAPTGTTVTGF